MKKVTDEELSHIKILRDTFLEIVTTMGELQLNKLMVQQQLNSIDVDIRDQEKKFAEFQEKERVLFNQLQTVYGTGNINMETGEITG